MNIKRYLGKIIGGICGLLLTGGSIFGALFGVWIGHWFDKSLGYNSFNSNNSQAQKAFFDTTFLVMGHIAKADGRVSESEIQVARKVMRRFGLTGEKKQAAMHLFNQGKKTTFRLNETLANFKKICPFDRALMYSFIEIQLQAAYADGYINSKTRHILQNISSILGLGQLNFVLYDMLFGLKSGYTYQQHYQQNYYQQTSRPYHSIHDAYMVLGVNKNATDSEVKKAYRKLMSQNHPDKLIAKGLPEEMIKVATEKTQKIQKAYEQICKARGMK